MAETYEATVSNVAVAAGVAKTVIGIASPSATVTGRIIAAEISFNGTNPSAVPALVEFVRYASDGTGTALTMVRGNGEAQNRANQTTSKYNYTVEPTTPTVVRSYYIPIVSGQPYLLPLGRELYLPANTVFGIRVNAPTAAAVAVNLEIEE